MRGSSRPAVVAIGGGHGTAVTLRAARRYAGTLTGVVSVADDGGSSGRLRELLNVVAVGDIVKVWVLEIDKSRRRVSLTMIAPGTRRGEAGYEKGP